jgi:hypothetical protein
MISASATILVERAIKSYRVRTEMKPAKLKEGDYLLSKKTTSDKHADVRRIGAETDFGFSYVQFWTGGSSAMTGACSASSLRSWGQPISEAEAQRLIPNMQQQLAALRQEESAKGEELARTIVPAVLTLTPDATLIQELERRGYTVAKVKAD